jgi:hypothetical protein
VIIHNLDIVGVTLLKSEANPPLGVDANAPLTDAVMLQRFQAIRGRQA